MFWINVVLTVALFIAILGVFASFAVMSESVPVGLTVLAISLLVGVGCFVGSIANYRASESPVTVKVESKERVNADKSSKYLVFTPNETFENTDSWAYWKFSSSDLYGALKEGKTYECKVAGWRVQFFSAYRNLIECKAK